MSVKLLLAGIGHHGRTVWCDAEIPKLKEAGRAELVGIIDPSPEAQAHAMEKHGLSQSQCYNSIDEALDKAEADVLIDSTLFFLREDVTMKALEAGLDVLMEKPVGISFDTSCRIYNKAKALGRKTAVNFTNRFFRDKQSFEHQLHSGECGAFDYIFTRFGWRENQRRHMCSHGQIAEGAVHALSYLLAMARSKAKYVTNHAWNPKWSPMEDAGSTNVFIEMENGVRCQMESSWAVRATIEGWGQEYVRADCEKGALELHRQQLNFYTQDQPWVATPHERPLLEGDRWGHELIANDFIDWVTGIRDDHPSGPEHWIQCMALLFAAIESDKRGGERVDTQALLEETLAATS